MPSIGIYKIENKINGHVYIGQSINIERRWNDHRKRRKDSSTILGRAFIKHGISNFSFEIIETCAKEELNIKETYWITRYNSYHKGYNATPGGGSSQIKTGKLNAKKVYSIRIALQENVFTKVEIAKQFNVAESTVRWINKGLTWYDSSFDYPIRKGCLKTKTKECENVGNKEVKTRKEIYCKKCNTKITKYAKTNMCKSCQSLTSRKLVWPNKYELISKLLKLPNTKVCKLYGVSDKTIAVWCKKYNIPSAGRKFKKLKWSAYPDSNRELDLRRVLVYPVNL